MKENPSVLDRLAFHIPPKALDNKLSIVVLHLQYYSNCGKVERNNLIFRCAHIHAVLSPIGSPTVTTSLYLALPSSELFVGYDEIITLL